MSSSKIETGATEMLSTTSLTPGMFATSAKASSRPTPVRSCPSTVTTPSFTECEVIEGIVIADSDIAQLGRQFLLQLCIGDVGSAHGDQIAYALHVRSF